ncbi:MAG: hypothetical protein EB075_09825 [Bacteroidetes bacterium]|jgi:hypothetical protein|nr:hypothetical protein [Bacteroidota bacterium]
MAVNETRSLNQDLREGITDGMVKKASPDRGGFPNDDVDANSVRATLNDELYDQVVGTNPMQGYHASRLTDPPR